MLSEMNIIRKERENDEEEENEGLFWFSPCLRGCVIGSLLAGIALAIIVTLWLTAPTKGNRLPLELVVASTTRIVSTTTSTSMTTRTTTTSSTTETESTTLTTKRDPPVKILRPGDFIMAIFNTTAGGPVEGLDGNYLPSEHAGNAIDDSLTTKYINFGFRNSTLFNLSFDNPGVGTGFIATTNRSDLPVACALHFATANDFPARDPLTVTLEGTNATDLPTLRTAATWTLIYNGSTGIDPSNIARRRTYMAPQNFSNTIAYRSYRLLVVSQRNGSNAVQYAEAHILGYP